ncbi:MAG: phosphatidylglycerophosphatase [Phycisphaerae bacterium]|nr:phosphatidylglycerophosphatase [Phycisphaerae bacterium]
MTDGHTSKEATRRSRPRPSAVVAEMGVLPSMAVTALGLGFLRPASGTWGSLPPAVVAGLLLLMHQPAWLIDLSMVLLLAIGCVACLRFGRAAERACGGKDPGQVVADEVAGQAIVLLALPWASVESWGSGSLVPPAGVSPLLFDLGLTAVAFLLFRIFDVLKPPPANGLQKLGGGLGILVDDLIAGAMAAVLLQVVIRFLF